MTKEFAAAFADTTENSSVRWVFGFPVLATAGVVLREPCLSDAASLHEVVPAGLISRLLSRPEDCPADFGQFIRWLHQERRAGRVLSYGAVPKGTERAGGLIHLQRREPHSETMELSLVAGERLWDTGASMASAESVIDFAVRRAGVHRVEARVASGDRRLNDLMHELGGVAEGVLRKSLYSGKQTYDQILWSILADEWLAARPAATYGWDASSAQLDRNATAAGSTSASDEWGPPHASWNEAAPVLRGSGLTLREVEEADARVFFELLSTDDARSHLAPLPAGVDGFRTFIAWCHTQRAAGRSVCFAIVPHGMTSPVGALQVRRAEPAFRTAEWGIALGPAYWGSGYFGEAARLAIDWAFTALGVRRLEARTAASNVRGNRAAAKVGAVREACLRESVLLDGVYTDDVLWALFAEDWRGQADGLPPAA